MAKKKRRRRASAGGVNKSQAIRDYLKTNPGAGPKEVIASLGAQGLEVSPALVSNIKYGGSRMTKKKRRRRRKGTKRATAARARSSNDTVSLSLLMEAKKLADHLGGVEKAKRALDALSRLQ
ncbi:MAG: hypothetical protein WD847_01805 [Pirellulales bacterium]